MSIFSLRDNPANVWKRLRHLGLIKTKVMDRHLTHTVEEFNTFFANVAVQQNNDEDCRILDDYNHSEEIFDENKLYFKYVTPGIIAKTFTRIKSNAIGMDGISLKLVKMTLPYIMPIIEHIFNFSLMNGIVPKNWKTALIMATPKVKHPSMLQHYRPISILPTISKALERIVSEQILEFLTEKDLLDPCQFAYRRNSSTQTCMIRMLDDVRYAADCRKVTISILFNFSKAFDRVQHGILIEKLRKMGFSGSVLCWIISYLTDRMQAVRDPIENKISTLANIRVGVPQDFVLGPLLFTLYISDLKNALCYCKYNFYADDLQIYSHCEPRDLHKCISEVNEDIKSINEWTKNNGLMLNPDKTQAILFGTVRYVSFINYDGLSEIKINDSTIQFSNYVKYLSIFISNTLSWEMQVNSVAKNIRSKLYQLKISKHLLPNELKIRLIVSLIFPHLDYCCAAFTDITGQLNLKLQRALNACIRFACNVKWDEHVTLYYREICWLKTDMRSTLI